MKIAFLKAILEGKSKEMSIKSSAKQGVWGWKQKGLATKVPNNQRVKNNLGVFGFKSFRFQKFF